MSTTRQAAIGKPLPSFKASSTQGEISPASLHGKELRVGLTATTTFTAEGSTEVWVDAVRIGTD